MIPRKHDHIISAEADLPEERTGSTAPEPRTFAAPWREERGIVPDGEHAVYLTNDAQDSLIIEASQVAEFVNDALERGHAFFIDDELRLRPAASPSVTEPDYADEASEYCGSCPHQKIAHGWRRRPEAIPAGRCLSSSCPCDGFTPRPSVTEPEMTFVGFDPGHPGGDWSVTEPKTPSAPRTEAGRRLLEGRAPSLDDTSPEAGDRWADYNDLEAGILAIEAEAAAPPQEREGIEWSLIFRAFAEASGMGIVPELQTRIQEAHARLSAASEPGASEFMQAVTARLAARPALDVLDLIRRLANDDRPMSQDEMGGCVWCSGSPPRSGGYGYATANPNSHSEDCPWLEAHNLLARLAPQGPTPEAER